MRSITENDVGARLAKSDLDPDVNLLVVNALTEAGQSVGEQAPLSAEQCFLTSITVEGFRGIGPRKTLNLKPGPGLTLVVGRNGSGKSSFVEALEIALTGTSRRWSGRSKRWESGWRNLHHPSALTEASFVVTGRSGPATVHRSWEPGAPVEAATAWAQHHGQPRTTVDGFGWSTALSSFRPLLSYHELGSLLEDGPSALHDALSVMLGLDNLVTAADGLRRTRLDIKKQHDQVKDEAGSRLLPLLKESNDRRAARAAELLTQRVWPLDVLTDLVVGEVGEAESGADPLRTFTTVQVVEAQDIEQAAADLEAAVARSAELDGTSMARAADTARLLDDALRFHSNHGASDCPVCGNTSALSEAWRETAISERDRLRAEASRYEEAQAELKTAVAGAGLIIGPRPVVPEEPRPDGLDLIPWLTAWDEWEGLVEQAGPPELAQQMRGLAAAVVGTSKTLADAARRMIDERDEDWKPLALLVARWIEQARPAESAPEEIKQLKAAEDWIRATAESMRAERFVPIAEQAKRTWSMLRQQSNVDLENVALVGKGQSRNVELNIAVDGEPGTALGVMSQGELHALALSLFLPRAMVEQSPFRFIVIDDPVQAMDPARVEGLARALSDSAHHRQVIVFTHDDRLPTAVRRLDIPAQVIEVTRKAESVVELTVVDDPIHRLLGDARALAKTQELPTDVRDVVVSGLCRSAIEAACHEVVWLRRGARGDALADIEKALEDRKLSEALSLALFDDETRSGEVPAKLNSRWGKWAGDAFFSTNRGAHGQPVESFGTLIGNTDRLCSKLRELS